mmetsp:Transcript_19535/g.24622  ORF Transcript_19535/g.24622 Transcript_19535/m.24622 type:complete len:116 (+) Transcript_19535:412-759(+)
MNGPPNASFSSPLLEMAPASSLLSSPPRFMAANQSRTACNNGTDAANNLAPHKFVNNGQPTNINNGADNVWIIFLESRGCNTPFAASAVTVLTKISARIVDSSAAPVSRAMSSLV